MIIQHISVVTTIPNTFPLSAEITSKFTKEIFFKTYNSLIVQHWVMLVNILKIVQ